MVQIYVFCVVKKPTNFNYEKRLSFKKEKGPKTKENVFAFVSYDVDFKKKMYKPFHR